MRNIGKRTKCIPVNPIFGVPGTEECYVQRELQFRDFMSSVIEQLRLQGKARCVESYSSALNSFMQFRAGEVTMLSDITPALMLSYESYLHNVRGVTKNTGSFYMRILRAVFNRAAEQGLIPYSMPFRFVYTGVDKTVKRAISLAQIKKIKNLDLSRKPCLALTRDIFLFSFYTRGMSFVDIAFLLKRDLNRGVLTYCRRKTGQRLQIKWEKCMDEIVKRYALPDSPYLLPIIRKPGNKERSQYRNAMCAMNYRLKKIAVMAGLKTHLTMYVARHSWASIAKSRNVPLSVISEALGHDNEMTTQIYLASFENSVIDRANSMILKLL